MDRTAEQIEAALRYLLYAGVGSVLYLCGAALLWREFGTLDLAVLAARVQGTPASIAAAALMTAGLAAKTALFPLHAWLPPAHAGAPPAASALHAALVVKGPFFLLLRLWSDGVVALPGYGAAQLVAAFGAAAIVLGGLAALAQDRLKALVAWSTVGQVGYLFVMLPMLAATDGGRAWLGGMLQALAHALAKAGMFLAAGSITDAMREDRLDRLQGAAARRPVAVAAFLACGLSLMGVPPSGGFTAKWLLLTAALSTGQWWWAVVIVLGGVLTGGYVWRVAAAVLAGPAQPAASPSSQDPWRSGALVVLSIVSMVLGLLPLGAFQVIAIGRGPGVMQ
jgi:formate hydrogenlyase subunit 3/multisubunit Na+/H+ antiporter MnhD subunit